MRRSRAATVSCLLVGTIALLVATGCQAPGYNVERDILFEPAAVLDVKAGLWIPRDDDAPKDFDESAAVGLKLSYEYMMNALVGIDLGMGDTHGETSFEERLTAVLSFDFEIPLIDSETSPAIRFGVGPGIAYFTDFDDEAAFFIIRPNLGFRLPLTEDFAFLVDGYYDFTFGDEDNKFGGTNQTIEPDDFAGFVVMAGVSFKFR